MPPFLINVYLPLCSSLGREGKTDLEPLEEDISC